MFVFLKSLLGRGIFAFQIFFFHFINCLEFSSQRAAPGCLYKGRREACFPITSTKTRLTAITMLIIAWNAPHWLERQRFGVIINSFFPQLPFIRRTGGVRVKRPHISQEKLAFSEGTRAEAPHSEKRAGQPWRAGPWSCSASP